MAARGLVAVMQSAWPAAAAAASPAETSPPAVVPEGLELPRTSLSGDISYPAALSRSPAPPAGDVIIKYTVDVDGSVVSASVLESLHPALDALALEAVLRATHVPGMLEGEPVQVTTTLAVRFEPSPPEEAVAAEPSQSPAEAQAEPPPKPVPVPVRIRGVLLEAGLRHPIANATVIAMPGDGLDLGPVRRLESKRWHRAETSPAFAIAATTAADGSFELRGVPPGRVLLAFVNPGFERLEYAVDTTEGTVVEGKFFAVRDASHPYRTVVEVDAVGGAEVTRRVISGHEAARVPGSAGDALRGLQNLPGLARTPFGLGNLIIRGAAPGDSALYLGGHEVPLLYHFGGFKSVFNSELLGSIAYVPSNFDARYGDATGGIVDVTTRSPRRTGIHGYVNADAIDASTLLEGPVGKGSFAVAARRSHIDLILRAVDAVQAAPRYWDYQGLFEHPVGPGEIGVRLFGSDDELVSFTDATDGFELRTAFHRADVYYRQKAGNWQFEVSPSFGFDQTKQFGNAANTYTFSTRLQAAYRRGDRFGIVFGTETRAGWSDISLASAGFNEFGPIDSKSLQATSDSRVAFATPALYATANVTLGRKIPLTLSPGVRLTAYATPLQKVAADPRLNVSWQLGDRLTLVAGAGLYSQAPSLVDLDRTFGNPDLEVEKSMHSSAGAKVELPYAMSIELTGFYKHLWDMTMPALGVPQREGVTAQNGDISVPGPLASTGFGRSYGGEFLLRRDFTARLYGWLAYTLARTELRRRGEAYAPADTDQTHNLTLVAGYKLPRNWSLGTRFRLSSGNPMTPEHNAIYEADTGRWNPIDAPYNSGRLPLFHQLDLRIDKTWTLRKVRLLAYLDVQNVYYAKNAEFLLHSYDSRTATRVQSLPIFPSLGFRLDW